MHTNASGRRGLGVLLPAGPGFAVAGHLRANGNAYRVAMTYEPSNTPVTTLAQPAP